MVTYLHSKDDAMASSDLARIYDTRTLDGLMEVRADNAITCTSQILSKRAHLVVPAEEHRLCDELLKVLRCARILGLTVHTVDKYLNELGAPASAQAHANAEGTGAPLRLPAHEAG